MFNHQYIPGYYLKTVVGEQPSPVVQTATLFGSMYPRRTYEDLAMVKLRL